MALKLVKRSGCVVKLNLFSKIPMNNFIDFNFKESLVIFDYIRYRSEKAGCCDEKGFVLCPSKVLKKLFGSNYSYGINELLSRKLIKPKWMCDKNGNKIKYSQNEGIATSYKITFFADNLVTNKQYKYLKKELNYTVPESQRGKFKLKKKSKNPKDLKLLDAYQGISIDPRWIEVFQNAEFFPPDHYKYPSEPIARTGFFYHSKGIIEAILQKTIPVKTDSECGRAFQPNIRMPKILRPYIRYKGERLMSIDATAFHPFLIGSCIQDIHMKTEYLEFVRGDFYEHFTDKDHSRDSIKVALQKFLSGKTIQDSKVLEIKKWFQGNYPDVLVKMRELNGKNKTFQMYLQQLESRIFVDGVFMNAGFWCLPMHDGLCVLEEDENSALELINRVCECELGYSIKLKSEKSSEVFQLNSVR
jgi:hypothetical protein